MTTWWETPDWHQYEAACGDEPGTRAALLAAGNWQTRIIDARGKDLGMLWRGVRKGYRSLIRRTEKEYPEAARRVVCGPSGGQAVPYFREWHNTAAGGETRPAESWDVMAAWLEESRALAVFVPGKGFAFFTIYGAWAYYHSAVALERDLGIALIWWCIIKLRENGVEFIELGWQGEADSEKGKNIEFVRRGFGGKNYDLCVSGVPFWESVGGGGNSGESAGSGEGNSGPSEHTQ